MEYDKRRRILNNIPELVNVTNYYDLKKLLQEKQILTDEMITNIENAEEDIIKRHELLFEKVAHRKSSDFEKLVQIFQELDFYEAIQIIMQTSETQNEGFIKNIKNIFISDSKTPLELEVFTGNVSDKINSNINKSNKFHYHDILETYKMTSKHRGILFLVNIIEFSNVKTKRRNGAEVDSSNLIKLFTEFGFQVYFYENLQTEDFNKLIDKFVHSEALAKTDCLIFALLTHGDEGNSALFSDGGLIHVENLLHKFNNFNCPFLKNKPKMFIFPFCRGNHADKGVHVTTHKKYEFDGTASKAAEVSPEICTDMLICYGTVPGFETHREPDSGSWYIKELCEVFAENAHNMHVEDLLKIVHIKVMRYRTHSQTLQTPSNVNREFNKILYLNPGYYD